MLGCKMLKTTLPDDQTINMFVNKQLHCTQQHVQFAGTLLC
jgi:hypothetical protein